MKTYTIGIAEVWYRSMKVNAENEEEAKNIIEQNLNDIQSSVIDLEYVEYSHELPKDQWIVENTEDLEK